MQAFCHSRIDFRMEKTDKGQSLLKFVCSFQVKFNFPIENIFLR